MIGEFSTFKYFKALKQDERDESYESMIRCQEVAKKHEEWAGTQKVLKGLNFVAMMAWYLAHKFVEPPAHLPDLIWVAQNAFCLAWWFILQILILWQMSAQVEKSGK